MITRTVCAGDAPSAMVAVTRKLKPKRPTLNEINVRMRFQFKLPAPCSDSSDIEEGWTQKKQCSLKEVVAVTGSVLLVGYLPRAEYTLSLGE